MFVLCTEVGFWELVIHLGAGVSFMVYVGLRLCSGVGFLNVAVGLSLGAWVGAGSGLIEPGVWVVCFGDADDDFLEPGV